MKVSAIMPTFNQAEFLQEAIESVVHQVDRLLIMDDGSTDGTREWLVEKGDDLDSWRGEENKGTAAAINSGIRHLCRDGDLLTWVSSDNVHTKDWRHALERLFTDKVGAAYSAFWYGMDRKRVLYQPYDPKRLINSVNCYIGPSFMIRRDVWEKAGDHRGKISHDYDHWLRVEEACWEMGLEIVSTRRPLCAYRVHDKRVTVTRKHEFDARHWQEEARKRRAT